MSDVLGESIIDFSLPFTSGGISRRVVILQQQEDTLINRRKFVDLYMDQSITTGSYTISYSTSEAFLHRSPRRTVRGERANSPPLLPRWRPQWTPHWY